MVTNDQGTVLYTGSTSDLTERIYFHQKGMISGFTKKYNVHKLVYFERYEDMASARKRERELKGKTRAKKEAIINHANPREIFHGSKAWHWTWNRCPNGHFWRMEAGERAFQWTPITR